MNCIISEADYTEITPPHPHPSLVVYLSQNTNNLNIYILHIPFIHIFCKELKERFLSTQIKLYKQSMPLCDLNFAVYIIIHVHVYMHTEVTKDFH